MDVIDGKKTNWEGLWYHPESYTFSSASINLAQLRKFKGNVKIIVRKNRYYNNGENGRPNYIFMIVDSKVADARYIEVIDDDDDDNETMSEYEEFCKKQVKFM